jgi:hypothetical protein
MENVDRRIAEIIPDRKTAAIVLSIARDVSGKCGEELWGKVCSNAQADRDQMRSRDLLNYALVLVATGDPEKRLRRVLDTAKEMQRSDGHFWWSWADKRCGNGIRDLNAVEFCMRAAAPLYFWGAGILGVNQRKMLRDMCDRAGQACLNRRVTRSNTNIALLNAMNLMLLGKALDRKELLKEGYSRFGQFCIYTWEWGIHEFSSPTYSAMHLECLGMIDRFAKDVIRDHDLELKEKLKKAAHDLEEVVCSLEAALPSFLKEAAKDLKDLASELNRPTQSSRKGRKPTFWDWLRGVMSRIHGSSNRKVQDILADLLGESPKCSEIKKLSDFLEDLSEASTPDRKTLLWWEKKRWEMVALDHRLDQLWKDAATDQVWKDRIWAWHKDQDAAWDRIRFRNLADACLVQRQARQLLRLFWTDIRQDWVDQSSRLGGVHSRVDDEFIESDGRIGCSQEILSIPDGRAPKNPPTTALYQCLGDLDLQNWVWKNTKLAGVARRRWGPEIGQSTTHYRLGEVCLSSAGSGYDLAKRQKPDSAGVYLTQDVTLAVDLCGENRSRDANARHLIADSRCFFISGPWRALHHGTHPLQAPVLVRRSRQK